MANSVKWNLCRTLIPLASTLSTTVAALVKALLSQLMVNLFALQVNNIQTQVHWESFGLLEFLSNCGFKATQNLVLNKSLPLNFILSSSV